MHTDSTQPLPELESLRQRVAELERALTEKPPGALRRGNGAAGEREAAGGASTDSRERRQAEEALRRSERQYRTLVENLPDIVGRYRRDLTILYMNPAVAIASGKPPEHYIGRPTLEVIEPDPTINVWVAAMERVFETGQSEEIEYSHPTRNGMRQFKTRLVPEIEKGRVETVLCISQDVTEPRKAEAQRLEMERRILETQRLESLGTLAGGVAHDFNNLLMAIMGYAEMARMELPPDSRANDAVQKIEAVAQRAADLTRQVLAYAGRGSVVIAPLALNELVSEMAQLIRVSIPKTARLETHLAPNLPPVEADATQIRQIVMNLVFNAAEALRAGQGTILMTTETLFANRAALEALSAPETLAEGAYVILEVADTGIGMNAETLSRIFEPFFTTKFTGRGLGLAAAQGIARSHGGALLVQSEPGQGTTFRLLLPVSAASSPALSEIEAKN